MNFETAARMEAHDLDVPEAAMLAVMAVESSGNGFAPNGAPLIRYEGHYVYRLLPEGKRKAAVRKGLAHPKAGGVPNPSRQSDRYALLARAVEFCGEDVAYSSVSVGCGQVMCAHWRKLGYASPKAMFDAARTEVGQVDMIGRFIKANGLIDEMRRGDWAGFARVYNGPKYRNNRYDEKLAEAFARYSPKDAAPLASDDFVQIVQMGDRGELVKELQRLLTRAGFAVKVDGDYGPSVKRAVRLFQAEKGLVQDGKVGPATWTALRDALPFEAPIERANMTTAELAKEDPLAGTANALQTGGKYGIAALGSFKVADATGVLQQGQDLLDQAQSFRPFLAPFRGLYGWLADNPAVVAIVVCFVLYFVAKHLIAARQVEKTTGIAV